MEWSLQASSGRQLNLHCYTHTWHILRTAVHPPVGSAPLLGEFIIITALMPNINSVHTLYSLNIKSFPHELEVENRHHHLHIFNSPQNNCHVFNLCITMLDVKKKKIIVVITISFLVKTSTFVSEWFTLLHIPMKRYVSSEQRRRDICICSTITVTCRVTF